MEEIIVISAKEKQQHFFYLFILYFIASIILICIIRINNNIGPIGSIDQYNEKEFIALREKIMPIFDSAYSNILELKKVYKDPNVNMEDIIADIKNDIRQIREFRREAMSIDTSIRYKEFIHMENFLTNYKDEMVQYIVFKKEYDNSPDRNR